MKSYLDKAGLQDYTTKLHAKNLSIFATRGMVGTPLVASTAAEMTDTDKIYVYVGSETGYTSGNWYYYNGSAWASGGVYNSQGIVLDTALTSTTNPAQGKAVGDAVSALSDEIENYEAFGLGVVDGTGALTWTVGKYLDDAGDEQTNSNTQYSDYIPVTDDKMLLAFEGNLTSIVTRVHGYNASKVWQKLVIKTAPTSGINTRTLDTSAIKYIRISLSRLNTVKYIGGSLDTMRDEIADLEKYVQFQSDDSVGVSDTLLSFNTPHDYTGTNNIVINRAGVSDGSELYAYIKSDNFANLVDGSTVKFYLRQMNSGNTANIETCDFSQANAIDKNQLVAHIPYDADAGLVSIIYILGNNVLTIDALSVSVGGYKIESVDTSVYYVSAESGNDANNGTREKPFATINKALRTGGKTIYVEPGTYNEMVSLENANGVTIGPYGFPEYSTEVPATPMIILDGGVGLSIDHGISITNCMNIKIENVHCKNTSSYPIMIEKVNGLYMKYCKASDSLNAGFSIGDCFGTFDSCEAYDLGDEESEYCDGFGIHGYGDTTFINCSAHDNQDDGISHHYGCTGTVIGGEWYNNGKGGVCTPTYGAQVNITGVYCHDNAYGIYILNEQVGGRQTKAIISNSVMKNNSVHDFDVRGGSAVIGINNIYDTKYVSDNSTLTEFGN